METQSVESEPDVQTCGWRSWRPKFLQRLNSPKYFLFFLTIFSTVQAMTLKGFTAVGLTTLEKRFKLSSKQSGSIVGASDVSSLFLIAFISYYGGHRHKARWLGIGALVASFGCLFFVLPHVLAGKYIPGDLDSEDGGRELCYGSMNSSKPHEMAINCEDHRSEDWKYMFVFIGATLLLGAGTTPLYTLGPAYIDENVDPKDAPLYLGVFFVATIFGPGIGYLAGGSLLNIYVDIVQPPGLQLSPTDPRWVGAWWLGYFFGGLLLLISSIALLGYPKQMPGSKERRQQAIKEGAIPADDEEIRGTMKQFIPATKTLLTNPTYMFNTLALTSTTMIAYGLAPFIAKYIQSEFGPTSATAGILSGAIIIPGSAGGILLGSYLVMRADIRELCKKAAKYCIIFQFLGIFGTLAFLIPGCKTAMIAGVNTAYSNSTAINDSVIAVCNVGCHCPTTEYYPICGEDKITYFSPCLAGCQRELLNGDLFADCDCIWPDGPRPQLVNFTGPPIKGGVANKGVCDPECKTSNLIFFVIGAGVLLLLNFMNATPNKLVVMRCVPDNQRSYALGLQWLFLSACGSIPGPVLFGAFIDKTCTLWEDTCGSNGSCLAYDNNMMSYLIAVLGASFQVLSTIMYYLSWHCYEPGKERRHRSVVSQDASTPSIVRAQRNPSYMPSDPSGLAEGYSEHSSSHLARLQLPVRIDNNPDEPIQSRPPRPITEMYTMV